MIYILRHPKKHKEVKTDKWWRVLQYRNKGYKVVSKYDPSKADKVSE